MATLSVKESLRAGWKCFKTRPWLFVQMGLVLLAVNVVISLVQELITNQAEQNTDPLFIGASLLVALMSVAASFLISMGETHFFLRAHDSVETASLKNLWHPKPFWKFAAAAILGGIAMFIGLLLLIVPGIILGVLLVFFPFIIIEKGTGPIAALKESAALTKGNRWKIFWLSLAMLGINILGLLALVVGLFVTIPVTYLALVHAYRELSQASMTESSESPEVLPA